MPVPTDAWVQIGAATSPGFSKDGRTLFHLRGAGLPQVWAMDVDGGNACQLSHHDEKVAFLRRCPTDDRLIWGIDAGGDERQQFWLKEPGAEPRALTEAPDAIHDFGAWSADGARIAYAANDRDERFYDISVMDLASGARTRLLEGSSILTVPSWTPDMARLVVIEDHSSLDSRLWITDAASGATRALPRTAPSRFASLRWVETGTALMGLSDAGADIMRLCRIDPETGASTVVFEAQGRDVEAWSLSPDETMLATIENDRGYAVLRVGPADSERPVVTGLPTGIVADLAWAPDNAALAFTVQGPTTPPGIWLWRDGAAAAPIPREDPMAASGIDPDSLIEPVLVEWESFDGLRIPGWYAHPRGPAPAGGFPAVMWVHGGPASQTRANFRPDIQMLLSQGFAVLMPNARGSTGYGRAYMEADEVEKRPDFMEDLATGRAWLATQPDIDPNRIGIMGQSYGGWAVLAAVTLQPDLWKAAVDYYGIANFATLLERTGPWRRNHRAREYGFPGTDDELFRKISPIHHIDRVVAPMLLLHGDRDPRVPMHESDQFSEALALRQKKVAYERFTYAGHGFIRPDHRRRVYASVVAHFREHL
ncbi:Dipeptidyl aminopeptidase/acylaminoacyl peptidase [Rhizobiales bacterium GAS191]|nr:Dipeptidyl aminopeptidase/acylaminoacyl peptidase [Rhizobiales bacterium GAS113]SEC80531.1 Dipeptidyl aminopeptidase/acylaminoacyl peptidase [Rhizobiales bacterium GAS191]